MRWHPLIIRWCLSIYLTSPAAYRHTSNKRNKFLVFPHINTLKKYISFTDPSTGFNEDILQRLVEKADLENIKDYERLVALSFDEMKIKSGLVYRKGTDEFVGNDLIANYILIYLPYFNSWIIYWSFWILNHITFFTCLQLIKRIYKQFLLIDVKQIIFH